MDLSRKSAHRIKIGLFRPSCTSAGGRRLCRDQVTSTARFSSAFLIGADPRPIWQQNACLALNPDLKVEVVDTFVRERDLEPLLKNSMFVLDCFDKNADRLAINRTCMNLGIPAVHGFAQDFSGEIFAVIPGKGSCLACAMDESFPGIGGDASHWSDNGGGGGLYGLCRDPLPHGHADPEAGCRLIYDLVFPGITKVPVLKNPHCSACAGKR